MISIEMCREILNQDGKKYSDIEIKKIREFLYTLSEIEMNVLEEALSSKQCKVVKLNNNLIYRTKSFNNTKIIELNNFFNLKSLVA